MLALSQEGGTAGELTLPLLVDDADWDRFGDRMRQIVNELEDHELSRLLLALRGVRGAELLPASLPAEGLRGMP